MSTITQLNRFSRNRDLDRPLRAAPNARFRELWADGLATVSVVTLASTVAFEAIRMLM